MSWALPVTWPAAVYSLEVGIVGTTGVLTIDDTHRDIVLAVSQAAARRLQPGRDAAGRFPGQLSARRHGARRIARADGGGDRYAGSTASRSACRRAAATVEEAHRNLMLTKALDLSAKRKAAGEAAARPRRREGGGVTPSGRTHDHAASCGVVLHRSGLSLTASAARADDYPSPADPDHRAVRAGRRDRHRHAAAAARRWNRRSASTLVIENKSGAAGNIGMELAARAAA